MRPIDADALIEKCGGWYVEEGTESGFIGTLKNLLATMPTIQPQSTTGQLNDGARSTAQSTNLIDRQAAIDAVNNAFDRETLLAVFVRSIALRAIRDMPTAQPEHKVKFADKDHVWIDGKQYISLPRFQEAVKEAQPKEGHWIEVAGELECSECHTVFTDLYPDYADSVACPHCGTKMTISTK